MAFHQHMLLRELAAPLALVCVLLYSGCSADLRGEESAQAQSEELAFEDVTQTAGLGDFRHESGAYGMKWYPEIHGSGGGFVDYDGDHWLDVVLIGGGVWSTSGAEPIPAVRLFRNRHDGTFEEATDEAGLAGISAIAQGVTAADYDNDGDIDLYVTTYGPNLLLRNDGGRFTEVARLAGVDGDVTWSTAAVFFDADRDGWLDLYVGNYVKWSMETDIPCVLPGDVRGYCTPEAYIGEPPVFYRNNRDGTFSEATALAGFLPSAGKTLGAAASDVDGDGWVDLLVANDTEPDQFYRNNGDGTFVEIGTRSGMAVDGRGRPRAGMGIDLGIVDDTGFETLFVGNFTNESMSAFRYTASGAFEDRAAPSGIGRHTLATLTFGLILFDADLDGDLDLMAANGHVQSHADQTSEEIPFRQRPQLFINDGSGKFTEVAREGIFDHPLQGRGLAWGDYDRDGDADVLLTENDGPAHLWRNKTRETSPASARFLRLALLRDQADAGAAGTRVVAHIGNRAMSHTVRSGASYLSQSQFHALFGLGRADMLDSLVVWWPDGDVERFEDVAADQELLLTQGSGQLVPLPQ